MTVELLGELSHLGVQLWPEGRNLRFRAPKGVLTAELRNQLARNKSTILSLLRRRGSEYRELHPLSVGQAALWFLYQSATASAAYNVAYAAEIDSAVVVTALRDACQALMDRHASLRTTYVTHRGTPHQEIHGNTSVDFNHTDASGWTAEQIEAALKVAYSRPFDLSRGPSFRVYLFTRSSEAHILLIVVHHIAVDGWSVGLLLEEIGVLYAAQCADIPSSLPLPDAKYIDYVQWQRELLDGPEGERLWRYWQRTLGGELPSLNLPTDRPRAAVRSLEGASYSFPLSDSVAKGLRGLASTEGATLYMVLLATFEVLLHRYAGQEDLLVGSPMAGRSLKEWERIIGYFVNMVVLRSDLSGSPSFLELLRRTRAAVLGALAHQEYPFALLVERLAPDRDPSRTAVFQAVFNFLKLQSMGGPRDLKAMREDQQTSTEVLRMHPIPFAQQEGQFDLVLEVVDVGNRLVAKFKYSTALFNADTIARMAGHYCTLIEGIVAHPEQRIKHLAMLTAAEQRKLLVEWNDTKRAYPRGACFHTIFESQVVRTPNAVAVSLGSNRLTYRELNERANQLAHYLQSRGVKPEVLVGICCERSIEMLVAILAVLKAGGAYVPLDPRHPKARVEFTLKDADAPILLTQAHLVADLPSGSVTAICLDSEWNRIAQCAVSNPASTTAPGNLAYVLYTSGSTGQPKGVEITHENLVHYLHWVNDDIIGDGIEWIPVVGSLTFDGSLKQLLAPLLRGAEVWMLREAVMAEPADLTAALASRRQVALNVVPSVWVPVLEALDRGRATLPAGSLTHLLLGGEYWTQDLMDRSVKAVPGLRLWNLYGPTETTANASAARLAAGDSVTIGRPIGDTQIYLLDRYLQPVPIGVPGELYVGGAGVARGYLRRPDLTAERFIHNPFSDDPAARLYRTGDLARYLSDGRIEFLGRIDHQVKIRGVRIELGEVESVLRNHADVAECVVLARPDASGQHHLAAYVTTDRIPSPSMDTLRAYLRERLPEYMVPSRFMFVDTFPLTPSGKIDRTALPAPEESESVTTPFFIAPRGRTEETLAAVWCEVLGAKRVGVDDNFFDRGGHSLLVMQVLSRVDRIFAVGVPVRHFFESPTIRALANYLESRSIAGSVQHASEAIPGAVSAPAGASNAAERDEIEL